ncbi:HAMP domain-containing sensor histidine kinase [Persicobacter psychrovividus]|uniref:histidine kinase n=1 Tax=Persicobacter psychrovividus TaxID=387638 RepID=A0ABM7VCZ5_9BACT|nr:hypothetical protein PEPS_10940 [Persicobacter psychrovividus]
MIHLKHFINIIIGDDRHTTLAVRTLNAITLFATFSSVLNLVLFEELAMPEPYRYSFSIIALCGVVSYTLNRFFRWHNLALLPFILSELTVFGTDFFIMGGITGPAPILLILLHIINFNLLNKKFHLHYFITFNILIPALCVVHYYQPQLSNEISDINTSRLIQFVLINFMSTAILWIFKHKDSQRAVKLEYTNNRQHQLIHAIENDFFIVQFDHQQQIIYTSPSTAQILQTIPKDAQQSLLQSLVHLGVATVTYEKKFQFDNGEEIYLSVNQHEFDDPETGKNIQLIVQNITNRKTHENKILNALQKESELNRMKNEFITMVSHQFRTPLTTIQSANQLIQYQISEGVPLTSTSVEPRFNQVFDAINSLTEMMERLLDYGKMEANELQARVQPTNLKAILLTQVKRFHHNLKIDRIKATFEGEERLLNLDPYFMEHVIINLISNAIKYSEGDIFISLKYGQQECQLAIKDHGIGISPQEIPHLFEPFYRAKNTENIKGTGIGLSFVKKIVELHGGEINVQSTINKATVFTLKLPYQFTLTQQAPPPYPKTSHTLER